MGFHSWCSVKPPRPAQKNSKGNIGKLSTSKYKCLQTPSTTSTSQYQILCIESPQWPMVSDPKTRWPLGHLNRSPFSGSTTQTTGSTGSTGHLHVSGLAGIRPWPDHWCLNEGLLSFECFKMFQLWNVMNHEASWNIMKWHKCRMHWGLCISASAWHRWQKKHRSHQGLDPWWAPELRSECLWCRVPGGHNYNRA